MLNNVPTVGQSLAQTRDPIAANFSTIDTAFAVNHVPYNVSGPSLQGLHQFVQMPAGTPIIATAASQIGLYAKNGVSSGQPELYFQRQNLAADAGYAITEFGTGTFSTASGVNYAYQWTRMPAGLILLWGSQTNQGPAFPGSGGTVITFPTTGSFPGFATTCYNVQITMQWADASGANGNQALLLVQGSVTKLKFNINRESQNSYSSKGAVSFFAVGI